MKQISVSVNSVTLDRLKQKQKELGVPVNVQIRKILESKMQSGAEPYKGKSNVISILLTEEQRAFLKANGGSKFLNKILEEEI